MNQAASQAPDPMLFPQAGAPRWQMLPPVPAATASFVVTRENVSPWACTKFHLLHLFTWGLPVTVLRVLENRQEGFTSEALAQTSLFPSLRRQKKKKIIKVSSPAAAASSTHLQFGRWDVLLLSSHYTETFVKI